MVCAGSVGPAPGCTTIDQLCCAATLPAAFARLRAYRAAQPFQSFSLKCTGVFGGADAAWAALLGAELRNFTGGLSHLDLDLSYSPGASDAMVDAVAAAVGPVVDSLSNLTLALEAANVSDAGAARLGKALLPFSAKCRGRGWAAAPARTRRCSRRFRTHQ